MPLSSLTIDCLSFHNEKGSTVTLNTNFIESVESIESPSSSRCIVTMTSGYKHYLAIGYNDFWSTVNVCIEDQKKTAPVSKPHQN